MSVGSLEILCYEGNGDKDVFWYIMTSRFMGTSTNVLDELQANFRTEK
jgi:hypothetical protein